MYLDYFEMSEFPFALTPDCDYYVSLAEHERALNALLISLRCGESFIKVIGDVGTGKTMLSHMLVDQLDENFISAYVSNPTLSPRGLLSILCDKLEIAYEKDWEGHTYLAALSEQLDQFQKEGKEVVLIIDEAQVATDSLLEMIRLLTNLETESRKLLHIVLFAQPELDKRLDRRHLRQLKQRISVSYKLKPISKSCMQTYINYRLSVAGNDDHVQLSPVALHALHKFTNGVPRLVNIVMHKALMMSFAKQKSKIGIQEMRAAIKDTKNVTEAEHNLLQDIWQRPGFRYGAALLIGFGIMVIQHYHLIRVNPLTQG